MASDQKVECFLIWVHNVIHVYKEYEKYWKTLKGLSKFLLEMIQIIVINNCIKIIIENP